MRVTEQIEDLQFGYSTLKSKISKLEKQVHSLQQWQDHIENWQRRVESLLDTSIDAKWTCPKCNIEFENLTEFLEHIVANINVIENKLAQHLEDKTE